jgi:hypothetical protein
MAIITLETQSAKLTAAFGCEYGFVNDGNWAITSAVKLHGRERLELGSGENIAKGGGPSDIEMYLTFRTGNSNLVEWATERTKHIEESEKSDDDIICGTVSYHPEQYNNDGEIFNPSKILFNIYTPPDVMASLLRFAENGRFVQIVTLEVRGMDYGGTPDGSLKKWADNAAKTILPIMNVSYELSLLEPPETEPEPGDPTTSVGADLKPVLNESLKWIKRAVALLMAITVVIVFESWR